MRLHKHKKQTIYRSCYKSGKTKSLDEKTNRVTRCFVNIAFVVPGRTSFELIDAWCLIASKLSSKASVLLLFPKTKRYES